METQPNNAEARERARGAGRSRARADARSPRDGRTKPAARYVRPTAAVSRAPTARRDTRTYVIPATTYNLRSDRRVVSRTICVYMVTLM